MQPHFLARVVSVIRLALGALHFPGFMKQNFLVMRSQTYYRPVGRSSEALSKPNMSRFVLSLCVLTFMLATVAVADDLHGMNHMDKFSSRNALRLSALSFLPASQISQA